jgi:hypothetical protein
MRFLFLIFCSALFVFSLKAQVTVSGKLTGLGVMDTSTKADKKLSFATITNFRSQSTIFSQKDGSYSINAKPNDTIEYKYLGYFGFRYVVPSDANGAITNDVSLKLKSRVLSEIRFKGLSEYQLDSIERAERYVKPLAYTQNKSAASPVTAVYEQFSKKYKNLRKFQEQYGSFEEQKFIDTKYSYQIVKETTGLEGDAAAYFMNAYPMEYKFARIASPLEIKMWVIDNYRSYNVTKDSLRTLMDKLRLPDGK